MYAYIDSKYKRRRLSCFCSEHYLGKNCKHSKVVGTWETFKIPKLKPIKPTHSDSESESEDESYF